MGGEDRFDPLEIGAGPGGLPQVFCRAGIEAGGLDLEEQGEVKLCSQPICFSGQSPLGFQRAYIIGTRELGRNPIKILQSSCSVRFSCLF